MITKRIHVVGTIIRTTRFNSKFRLKYGRRETVQCYKYMIELSNPIEEYSRAAYYGLIRALDDGGNKVILTDGIHDGHDQFKIDMMAVVKGYQSNGPDGIVILGRPSKVIAGKNAHMKQSIKLWNAL